jgi:hypothetical protein
MFEVRPNRPEEGERIVSIWRAAVAATHDFLLPEDLEEIAQNAQALGFYRHLGFMEIGHSPSDGQGRPYPLIHMRLLVEAIG